MGIQSTLARIGGNTWRSWGSVAVWPYPAVCVNFPHTQMTASDYRFFTATLSPGDFILTTSEPFFLSNRGIKCTAFKHLAVYTGAVYGQRDKASHFIRKAKSLGIAYPHTGLASRSTFERSVTHAISEGIVVQDFLDLFSHADWMCIVRPWTTQEQQIAIVDAALKAAGKDYDFGFKQDSASFYCTELGAHCCKEAELPLPETIRLTTSWKGMIIPSDRFKDDVFVADAFAIKYMLVGTSLSCNDPQFVKASKWRDPLRVGLLHAADADNT